MVVAAARGARRSVEATVTSVRVIASTGSWDGRSGSDSDAGALDRCHRVGGGRPGLASGAALAFRSTWLGEGCGGFASSLETAGRRSQAYRRGVGDFQQIRYDVDGAVATITLHRPEQMNAFTSRMVHEMVAAFDLADADDAVRGVVVTGAGRAFCAGADLSTGGDTFKKGGSDVSSGAGVVRDGGGIVSLRIFESRKPVIAAINGPAVGVGATMTLPMDIRIASTSARFGFVFTRRGIVPEAASSWFLPRIVGISQALEWSLGGRVFSAEEALGGGLVRSLHEPDDLHDAACGIVAEIAEHTAPVSVALARQMMWRMLGAEHPMAAHRADSRAIQERGRAADTVEGVTSFLEKRPAIFPDRVSTEWIDVFPDWEEPTFE